MPRPALGKHYAGDLGQKYFAWQKASGNIGARLNARKFAPHIAPADTVVDFGCGGGFLLEVLDAAEKIGIEPSEAARKAANERGVRVVASAADLSDNTVDIIVSNHALEHTISPWDELRELLRILKPGGKLCLWVPMEDWRTERKFDPADVNHHLYAWTPLLLGNLLQEAGFHVQEVRPVTHAWPPKATLIALAKLPDWAFDKLAWGWSALRRRRQLAALAVKPKV